MASLTHIAYHVKDLDACIDFYQRYCGMKLTHERVDNGARVVWMAEPGREKEMIMVLMPMGVEQTQAEKDYSHIGFAVASKEEVDDLASLAKKEGCLTWEPVQEPYPVGYYCGVRDPNGNVVEFSYGQPLGPGAEDA